MAAVVRLILTLFLIFSATVANAAMFGGGKGRGQILLNPGQNFGGSYAFINFYKQCANFNPSTAYPAHLNANGYFSSSPATQVSCNFAAPTNYTGSWILRWSGSFGTGGTAGVQFTGNVSGSWTVNSDPDDCVVSSGSGLTLTGSDCTIEITPNASFIFNFTYLASGTGANVNITNIELIRSDQLAAYDAGEVFNPDYITYLRGINPGAIRFLGWNDTNFNYRTRLSYAVPVTYSSYSMKQFVSTLWAGTASWNSGTDTYTISEPSGWAGLVDGATVQFYVPAASANNSTTPKLKVGAGASTTIQDGLYSSVDVGAIAASELITMTYDAKIGVWAFARDGFFMEVPVELQIALCNKLGVSCWLQAAFMWRDEDFEGWVQTIAEQLDPSLEFIAEYANEPGNFAAPPFFWLYARGVAIGFPTDGDPNIPRYSMTGYRFAAMAEAAHNVWALNGRDPSKVKPVLTFVTFENFIGLRDYTLTGTNLTLDASQEYCSGSGCTIVKNYSQSPNRPRDLARYIASATYSRGPNIAKDPNSEGNCDGCGWLGPRQTGKTISAITNAATGVVTITGHGWSNGDRVYLQSTPGMSTLSGGWTTVTNADTDTFQLSSDTTNSSGTVIGANSTGFGTYTGSGTAARLLPGVNDGIYTAIGYWQAGNYKAALDWWDADMIDGYRASTQGEATIQAYIDGIRLMSWEFIQTNFINAMGLPLIQYEGALEMSPVTTATLRKLGRDPAEAMVWNEMLTHWRVSDRSRNIGNLLMQTYRNMDPANFLLFGWSIDIAESQASSFEGSISGTTLTVNSMNSGELSPGQTLKARSIPPTAYIVKQLTGTPGGAGTYQLSETATFSTATLESWKPLIWSNMFGNLYSTPYQSMNAMKNFSAAP